MTEKVISALPLTICTSQKTVDRDNFYTFEYFYACDPAQ